ncbi:endoplasmic oxidoreductin-1 [Exserohilum turcicum]
MRPAAQVFYLAVFSLLGGTHGADRVSPSKPSSPPPNVCDISPGAIVSDACASYSTLEQLNDAVQPYLESITQKTDFFSHYRLNLYRKKCPFWDDENGMCGNVACAVNTLENEDDIPLVWRAKELGKLEGPTAQHPGRQQQREERKRPLKGNLGENVDESCVVEYDDECDERDYCIPEDESATAKGDYVSLVDNPERFTGYAGVGAQQVWEAIYRENCFHKPPKIAPGTGKSAPPGSPFGAFGNQQQMHAANQLRNVMQEQGQKQKFQSAIAHGTAVESLDPVEFDNTCLEKRVFHRVISGMHASISTHLCWDYLNQTTGQWGPNLACYEQRLHKYPERISNVYFNYALVMRAVGKIKRHISDYSFCSEDPEQDLRTKNSVLRLASALPSGPEIFDETVMFQEPESVALKEDFRNRFRNVSRIMDCVGCDKCRLWGKLQTNGYGTALKVLFEFDENDSSKDPPLRRTELVALINTMNRLSHSLSAIKEFRRMMDEREGVAPALPATDEGVLKTKLALEAADPEKPINVLTGNDDVPNFQRDWDASNMSVWDEVKAELNLVKRTFYYVLYQWTQLPSRFTKILILEMRRAYNWWMGFVPGPRSWEIRIPTRDEI